MANNLAIEGLNTRDFSTYVDQRNRDGGDDKYSHCSTVMLFSLYAEFGAIHNGRLHSRVCRTSLLSS
jgi:hypothetical protein